MKIFTLVGFLVVLLGVFAAGYWYAQNGSLFTSSTNSEEAATTTNANTQVEAEITTDSVEIPVSTLTDGQRQLLKSLGVDADSVTVTPAMMTCAEAAVGTNRLEAIKAGDTPSFTEGIKLFTCYSKN